MLVSKLVCPRRSPDSVPGVSLSNSNEDNGEVLESHTNKTIKPEKLGDAINSFAVGSG
jgi:hypothetical protein